MQKNFHGEKLLKNIWKFLKKHKKIFKITFSTTILIFVLCKIDFNQFINQLKQINISWYLIAFLLIIVNIVISSYKWWKILKFENYQYSFVKILKIYWVGFFYNQFLPGRIGGDVIKISLLLGREPQSDDFKASISIFIDRLFNLIGLLFLVIISMSSFYKDFFDIILYLPVFIFLLALVFFLIHNGPVILKYLMKKGENKFLSKYIKLSNMTKQYYNSINKILFLTISAIIFQTLVVMLNYYLGKSININVQLNYYIFFIPMLAIITMIPISWGGFGVREFSYIFFLNKVGVSDEKSLALSFLIYISITIISLPGYFLHNYGFKK